jgi:hypothetical protein
MDGTQKGGAFINDGKKGGGGYIINYMCMTEIDHNGNIFEGTINLAKTCQNTF